MTNFRADAMDNSTRTYTDCARRQGGSILNCTCFRDRVRVIHICPRPSVSVTKFRPCRVARSILCVLIKSGGRVFLSLELIKIIVNSRQAVYVLLHFFF